MRINQISEDKLPTRKLNRISSKSHKRGLFFCWYCDRAIVGQGGKCHLCGSVMKKGMWPHKDSKKAV